MRPMPGWRYDEELHRVPASAPKMTVMSALRSGQWHVIILCKEFFSEFFLIKQTATHGRWFKQVPLNTLQQHGIYFGQQFAELVGS